MPSEVMVESMESNGGNVENTEQHHHLPVSDPHGLMGKKLSWQKFPRNDSLDMESRSFPTSSHASIVGIPFFLSYFICINPTFRFIYINKVIYIFLFSIVHIIYNIWFNL